jgi:hypothetical protein
MATIAHPYAALLGNREPLGVIAETPDRLTVISERLGSKGLARSYAPGKWTAHQIVCHLADCELTFGYRWRQVVSEPHHLIQPFNQEIWAANYSSQDSKLALDSFCAARRWSAAWLRTLPEEAFSKLATHPERGELTLFKMLQITAGHDLNHLAQLDRIVAGAN